MKIILFFETKIGDFTYTIKTEESKELNVYRTTMEQKNHKGEIIERVCATYKGFLQKAIDIAYKEIKGVIC